MDPAPTSLPTGRSSAFSLIEVLMALAILGILFGLLTWNFAKTDLRRQSVRTSAEELAATFRQARAMAIAEKSTFAVVFHIQNDPTSSGKILNNRSSGHWYRILGPPSNTYMESIPNSSTAGTRSHGHAGNTVDTDNLPRISGPSSVGSSLFSSSTNVMEGSPYTVFEAAKSHELAWRGPAHALPAKRVRFLALSDMDYGDYITVNSSRRPSATPSYPRPWFGWFNATEGRLYPWGGYDATIAGSGFYFWGRDGAVAPRDPEPITCSNPADRRLDRWVPGQTSSQLPSEPQADLLYASGSPRPLINATWRDACLVFWANGEVRWGNFMPMRHNEHHRNGNNSGTPVFRGVDERCNGIFVRDGALNQYTQIEVGNFDRDTGGWFITLAPDVLQDSDTFDSAAAALDSVMPAYRVYVSALGDIQVIAVSRKADFNGLSAFPDHESWWRTGNNMRQRFGQNRLVSGAVLDKHGTGIGPSDGRPITDFLTPDMLANRSVWMR